MPSWELPGPSSDLLGCFLGGPRATLGGGRGFPGLPDARQGENARTGFKTMEKQRRMPFQAILGVLSGLAGDSWAVSMASRA
eukprot:6875851-Pyramimonas_sp.AAC.1